jgi:hypothetical protein
VTLPDIINALFELGTGLAAWHGCRILYRDKKVAGYSSFLMPWVTAWGFWNLFYYPHLDQWLSLVAGLVVVTGNCAWLWLAYYYGVPAKWNRDQDYA